MTQDEFESTVSAGFVRLLCAFVVLSVLYCCVKVGVRYFELESEPAEPFRYQGQAGEKV